MCFSYSVNFNKENLFSQIELEEIVLPLSPYFFSGFAHPQLPIILIKDKQLKAENLHWGLIPDWSKTEEQTLELRKYGLNARNDSVQSKPMFKESFLKKRCIVPASGFFEWKEVNKKKYPFYIYPKIPNEIFYFAGIHATWHNPKTGIKTNSFAIITCEANTTMASIHNTKKRMPVILSQNEVLHFLIADANEAMKHLIPCSDEKLAFHSISPLVNSKLEDRNVPQVQEVYRYAELEQSLLF